MYSHKCVILCVSSGVVRSTVLWVAALFSLATVATATVAAALFSLATVATVAAAGIVTAIVSAVCYNT